MLGRRRHDGSRKKKREMLRARGSRISNWGDLGLRGSNPRIFSSKQSL